MTIDPSLAFDQAEAEADADRAASLGDFAVAQAILTTIARSAPARVDIWLKLGATRRAGGNIAGALAAIDEALKVEPLHFTALLSRARMLEMAGERQEAARAYTRALAQIDEDQTPAGMAGIVAQARLRIDEYEIEVSATWDRAIAEDPALTSDEVGSLQRFKSNALRRTKVYHSEPTHYYYPGLVEREFHHRDAFPWLGEFERATPAIVAEVVKLLGHQAGHAEPYIQYAAGTPVRQWSELNHSLNWTAFHLLNGGNRVAENAALCPDTMAAIAAIDQPTIVDRAPNAMFSLLKPRTHIPPHTGISNTRLVCHLPLIVPPGCWFRCGSERREWRVGEAFIFDDTIEHEAMNDSDEPRVVLIIDLWHPGLGAPPRAPRTRIMEADGAQHGAPL